MRWVKPSPVVPWCTFTDPELARVGLSEAEAIERGVAHRVYRFAFDDIDRARAEGETEGLAKIVTDPKGKLLGAAIVGPHAGELIAEYVLALVEGDEREGSDRRHPRLSDARADQPPRRRSAAEGRPHAVVEDVDPAHLRPAGCARMSASARASGTEAASVATKRGSLGLVLIAVLARSSSRSSRSAGSAI